MRIIILILILFPSLCFGQDGDVYFCNAKVLGIVDGKITQYNPQKFKFKKNPGNITFGTGGYFNNIVMNNGIADYASVESFHYIDESTTSVLIYRKGKFQYSSVTYDAVVNIYGNCSIFK